jgi:CheY-like chemotaxis protein
VDDTADMRDVLVRTLVREGHDVRAAESGEQGLANAAHAIGNVVGNRARFADSAAINEAVNGQRLGNGRDENARSR